MRARSRRPPIASSARRGWWRCCRTREVGDAFRRRDGRVAAGRARGAALLDAGAARARAAADRPRDRRRAAPDAGVAQPTAVDAARSRRGRRCRPSSARWSSGSASTVTASRWWSARRGRARRSRSAPPARRGRRPATRCSASRSRAAPPASSRTAPGSPTTSVAALLGELAPRRRARCRQRCVLVVDEAGMVADAPARTSWSTRRGGGGKLVLVGDHRQLPELEAGGAFRGLVQRGLAVELTENHRQVARVGARPRSTTSATAASEQALALYAAHDRVARRRRPRSGSRAARRATGRAAGDPSRRGDDRAPPRRRRRPQRAGPRAACAPPARSAAASCGCPAAASPPAITWWSSATTCGSGSANGERGRRASRVDAGPAPAHARCRGSAVDARRRASSTTAPSTATRRCCTATRSPATSPRALTVDQRLRARRRGLKRESGYTALSRGRHTNHLYAAREPDTLTPRSARPAQRARPDRAPRRRARDRALPTRSRSTPTQPQRSPMQSKVRECRHAAPALEQSRWKPAADASSRLRVNRNRPPPTRSSKRDAPTPSKPMPRSHSSPSAKSPPDLCQDRRTWLWSAASTANETPSSGAGWSVEQAVRQGTVDTRAWLMAARDTAAARALRTPPAPSSDAGGGVEDLAAAIASEVARQLGGPARQ